jgi:hypothetical protein
MPCSCFCCCLPALEPTGCKEARIKASYRPWRVPALRLCLKMTPVPTGPGPVFRDESCRNRTPPWLQILDHSSLPFLPGTPLILSKLALQYSAGAGYIHVPQQAPQPGSRLANLNAVTVMAREIISTLHKDSADVIIKKTLGAVNLQ